MAKLSRIAPATIAAIETSKAQPTDRIVAALTEAPRSTTAISSSSLALKSIPGFHAAPGVQAVRTAAPTRMASTRASIHARPEAASSTCCRT